MPPLVSALSKKSFSKGQWPNLGLECLDVDCWLTGLLVIEYLGYTLQKLWLPRIDLIEVNIILL